MLFGHMPPTPIRCELAARVGVRNSQHVSREADAKAYEFRLFQPATMQSGVHPTPDPLSPPVARGRCAICIHSKWVSHLPRAIYRGAHEATFHSTEYSQSTDGQIFSFYGRVIRYPSNAGGSSSSTRREVLHG